MKPTQTKPASKRFMLHFDDATTKAEVKAAAALAGISMDKWLNEAALAKLGKEGK